MEYFAGLDVSVKETSVCIVDDGGRIVREAKVGSEPEALLQVLMTPGQAFRRIGLEAGALSQWLFSALAQAGLPVICVETRLHESGFEGADHQDGSQRCARHGADDAGGDLSPGTCQDATQSGKLRMLLTHRKLLQSKAISIDNDLRASLRNFGLKVGIVGQAKFDARIKELVEDLPGSGRAG